VSGERAVLGWGEDLDPDLLLTSLWIRLNMWLWMNVWEVGTSEDDLRPQDVGLVLVLHGLQVPLSPDTTYRRLVLLLYHEGKRIRSGRQSLSTRSGSQSVDSLGSLQPNSVLCIT